MPNQPAQKMITIEVKLPSSPLPRYYRVPLNGTDRTARTQALSHAENLFRAQMGLPTSYAVHSTVWKRKI